MTKDWAKGLFSDDARSRAVRALKFAKEVPVEKFGWATVKVLLAFGLQASEALALMWCWKWFVMALFVGAPPLGFALAIGLNVMIGGIQLGHLALTTQILTAVQNGAEKSDAGEVGLAAAKLIGVWILILTAFLISCFV